MTEFIKENMKLEVEVERTQKVRVVENNTIIIATLKSWEEKIRVMREKGKLVKGIYIDNDLTKKEREIQRRLRRIARAKRKKGEYVKIRKKKKLQEAEDRRQMVQVERKRRETRGRRKERGERMR